MEEQYNKIEQYLSGELDGEARTAFEVAISADAELHSELELHRRIAAAFADPGEFALRVTLTQIEKEEVPQEATIKHLPKRKSSWTWPILALAAAAIGFFLFYPNLSPDPVTPSFNSELEALIERGSSPVYDFELAAKAATVNGNTQLQIEGELFAADLPAGTEFTVDVYSSDPADYPAKPVYSTVVRPIEDTSKEPIGFGKKKTFTVGIEAPAPKKKTTYYYVVRDPEGKEVLYVGKIKEKE